MHELGIMKDVLQTVLRVADQNNGKKITKITLRVGVMSGLVAHLASSMFEVIARDTIAEGCEVIILEEPALFKCQDCGAETSYEKISGEYLCQACGSANLRLLSGFKSQIVNVGII